MPAPPLEAILNPEGVGVATYRILASLSDVEKQRVAMTITRTIETAVHEAIDPPAPNEDLQEFWWIFSPSKEEWGGLRQAVFRKAMNGPMFFIIANEMPHRNGPRDWEAISEAEGWIKIMRIPVPTRDDVLEHMR